MLLYLLSLQAFGRLHLDAKGCHSPTFADTSGLSAFEFVVEGEQLRIKVLAHDMGAIGLKIGDVWRFFFAKRESFSNWR